MRIYDNKLYACYGHMWKVGKKREAKATNNPFFILVYDLKNGELVERINCPAIDEHTVAAFIIGARNHKIYLYVIGNKESMSTFGDSIGYNWSSQGGAIIVVE